MSSYRIINARGYVTLYVLSWNDKRYHFAFRYPLPRWRYNPEEHRAWLLRT